MGAVNPGIEVLEESGFSLLADAEAGLRGHMSGDQHVCRTAASCATNQTGVDAKERRTMMC